MHGLIRRSSTFNTDRIDHLYQDPHDAGARLFLHYADLTDGVALVTLLGEIKPDEVYNLAAQSHVRVSFDEPEYTGDVDGLGTIRLLEAIRAIGLQTALLPGVQFRDVRRDPATAGRGRPRSTRARRTGSRRSTRTGSPGTTARHTACSRSTASCSTTSRPAAARRS